jgi:hypothetical protein
VETVIWIAALLFVTVTKHEIPAERGKIGWYRIEKNEPPVRGVDPVGCHYMPTHSEATVPRLEFASPVASKRANEIIEREARRMVGYGHNHNEPMPAECKGQPVQHDIGMGASTECEVTLANDHFVSIQCPIQSDAPTHPDYASGGINLLIHGDDVEELKFDALFTGNWRQAIANAATRAMDTSDGDKPRACTPEILDKELQSATFNRTGLVLVFGHHTFGRSNEMLTVPWSEIDQIVRPEILNARRKKR